MSQPFSPIVPIRPHGSAPPIFLIHGVGGVLPEFGHLLEKIPTEYPVYGIVSQALDPEAYTLTTLEELAAYYLREIRQVVPRGPYCFLGFSFGGMLAFEMAQQLKAEGAEPPFIGMIDSCEMSYLTRVLKQDSPVMKVSELARRLKTRFREAFERPDTFYYVREKIESRVMRFLYSAFSRFGVSIPSPTRKPYHVNWFAAVNYVPKMYEGHITLFKATNHFWDRRVPSDLGWANLVRGMEVFEIPGDHVGLFSEPNVTVLGNHLAEYLEAMSSAAGHSS